MKSLYKRIPTEDARRIAIIKNRLSDEGAMSTALYATIPVSESALLEEELSHLRLFAGRAGDPLRLYAFVMPKKKRERLGIETRTLKDGDYILTAVKIDGEAAPIVLKWDAHSRHFIDPVSGKMLFLLFEVYVLLTSKS